MSMQRYVTLSMTRYYSRLGVYAQIVLVFTLFLVVKRIMCHLLARRIRERDYKNPN